MNEQNELLSALQRGGKVRSLIKQYGSAPILLMQADGLIDIDAGEIKLTANGISTLLSLETKAAEQERREKRQRAMISSDGRQKRILDLEG
jgi:hypothetical protein